MYFKGELVRKELFHVGGIRKRGGGIGKSVWMRRRRLEDITLIKMKTKFSSYISYLRKSRREAVAKSYITNNLLIYEEALPYV